MAADETLLYTGKFDATGIVQGEAVAEAAFSKLNTTASKAFTSMESAYSAFDQTINRGFKNIFSGWKDGPDFIGPIQKVGTVSKETGRAMQQAGYQIGDFFVQLASGQGVIRPLIQQSGQLIQSFGMWGSIIGAATSILGALYVAIKGAKTQAQELSTVDMPDWITNPKTLEATTKAWEDIANANIALSAQLDKSNAVTSTASVYLAVYSQNIKDAEAAEKAFTEAVGMSTIEFTKKITQFVSYQQYVKDVAERADAKLLDINDAYTQAVINGKTNELERLEGLENLAYEKSLRSTRGYYTAIRDDVKKSDAERKRAVDQLQQAESTQLETHNQNLSNIEATYYTKQSEKQQAAQEKLFNAQVAAREKEISELRAFQKTRDDVNADVAIRLQEAGSGSELGKLDARQARERQAMQARLDDQAKNLDLSIAQYNDYYSALDKLAQAHALEREKVVKSDADKNKKTMSDATRDLARAYVSLGEQFADAFNVGPLKTFFGWLDRIRTMVETIRAIEAATKALSLFGGGGGFAIGSLLGFAAGGRPPVGRPSIVGEHGPEIFVPDSAGRVMSNQDSKQMMGGGASYSFGDIHVNVQGGADPKAVGAAVKSAVVEASEQIEKNRNQRFYTNGTFQF